MEGLEEVIHLVDEMIGSADSLAEICSILGFDRGDWNSICLLSKT